MQLSLCQGIDVEIMQDAHVEKRTILDVKEVHVLAISDLPMSTELSENRGIYFRHLHQYLRSDARK